MFFYLTNSGNEKVKDIEKAMWLYVGTDANADEKVVGERNRDLSGPAIRSFGDGIAHGIYNNPETKVDEHYYTNADLSSDLAENVGVNKLNGDWYQVDIIDEDRDWTPITPTVEFPDGAKLRKLKHRYFNILLKGHTLKIYIAHLRGYIKNQQFLKQWQLVADGEAKKAIDIRYKNINTARAGRRIRAVIRDNGSDEQLERAVTYDGNGNGEADTIEPEENVASGSHELFIKKYANKEEMMNMFDLPAGTYDLRVNRLVYPWKWDPNNATLVDDWAVFASKPTWSIDVPF